MLAAASLWNLEVPRPSFTKHFPLMSSSTCKPPGDYPPEFVLYEGEATIICRELSITQNIWIEAALSFIAAGNEPGGALGGAPVQLLLDMRRSFRGPENMWLVLFKVVWG